MTTINKKNTELGKAIVKALNWAEYELDNDRIENAEEWLATGIRLSANYIEEQLECKIANRINNVGMRCTFARL